MNAWKFALDSNSCLAHAQHLWDSKLNLNGVIVCVGVYIVISKFLWDACTKRMTTICFHVSKCLKTGIVYSALSDLKQKLKVNVESQYKMRIYERCFYTTLLSNNVWKTSAYISDFYEHFEASKIVGKW